MTTTTIKLGKQDDGSWLIREDRFGELMHEAAKLIKRASKTDTLPLAVTELERGQIRRRETCEGGVERDRVTPWVRVRIEGQAPVIAGFAFVARVEHHGEAGNIVSKAPTTHDVILPESLRTAAPVCEHCATTRKRNDTFVLQSEFGTFHQIGRNCLQDFLRGTDPDAALRMWRLLSQFECLLASCDEDGGFGGGGRDFDSTLTFLAAACATIRRDGWLSMTTAREQERTNQATANIASMLCGRKPLGWTDSEWQAAQPEEQDRELAQEVIGWAQGLGDRDNLSDYLHNVRVGVAIGYVHHKIQGVVASAIVAYKRELEQEVNRKRRAARGPGVHVGTIGKRIPLTLTVIRVRETVNDWGAKTILALEDDDGNEFVWFASGVLGFDAGDVVTGKGTVKQHGSYNGRAQTVLSRCAFAKAEKEHAA